MTDKAQKKGSSPKRRITEFDLEAGRNIKRLFEIAKAEGKIKNQEAFGELFGFSQSFTTQIMNGHTACPADKIMMIAEYFDVSTKSIRSDLPDLRLAGGDMLDEKLLEEVWTYTLEELKNRGFQIDRIRPDKMARLVIKCYKESQKTNNVDKGTISFAVELLA